jgi:hypothetical protein
METALRCWPICRGLSLPLFCTVRKLYGAGLKMCKHSMQSCIESIYRIRSCLGNDGNLTTSGKSDGPWIEADIALDQPAVAAPGVRRRGYG